MKFSNEMKLKSKAPFKFWKGDDSEKSSLWEKEEHPLRNNNMGFTDTEIRHRFIRKVYCIVLLQLTVTFGMIFPFAFYMPLRKVAKKYYALAFVFFCLAFCVLLIIVCGPRALRRKFPINLILLFCFTVPLGLCIAWTISAAYERYDKWTVLIAFGLTVCVVLSFTAFAMQTRIDMTKWKGIACLLVLGVCVMTCTWSAVAALVAMDKFTYNLIELAVATVGLLAYIVVLVIDTQLLLGGKHKYAISPEDYVEGALAIYLDIINIFMFILRILAAAKGLSGD